jgi:hypothetical protein
MWLQQTQTPHESLLDDPFIQNAAALTMETGGARSDDLELLFSLVDTYVRRGSYLDAIYLWLTAGDRAALETTSFRERYKLTPRTFGQRLSELLRSSGNIRRASLVDSMLLAMDKPDGLYL